MTKTVLVLDYPGPFAGARERHLGLAEQGFSVRHVLREVLPRETTASAYAAALYQRCHLANADVAAVVAHCAAGQIARELSGLCSGTAADRPRLVVVNPERPSVDSLFRTVEAVLRVRLPRPPADATDPFGTLTPEMFGELEQRLTRAYEDRFPSTDGTAARDLSAMQVDWAVHLVAASRPTTENCLDGELHIVAADHPCAGTCAARHVVARESSDAIFASPAVQAAISEIASGERRRSECP